MNVSERVRNIFASLVVLAIVAVPAWAQEAEEEASRLPASEAADWIGDWVLTVKGQQGDQDLDFFVRDVDGFLQAEIEMPRMGTVQVDDIAKTEDGLQLKYDVTLGEQMFAMVMNLGRTEEGLIGKMADESGMFSLAFTGVDKETALARAQAEGNDRSRRRGGDSETLKMPAGDGEITLRYDAPSTEDAAYALIEKPVEGEVVSFIKNRPPKLWIPTDLQVGEAVIPAHNHGEDYPGVYSLWLRQQDGQWHLVFNNLADVWGTQHDPEQDVAAVPLQVEKAAEPSPVMTMVLDQEESGSTLEIHWGDWVWKTPFNPKG